MLSYILKTNTRLSQYFPFDRGWTCIKCDRGETHVEMSNLLYKPWDVMSVYVIKSIHKEI